MNWYKTAKFYSVNRDDNELRVVICPKCHKPDIIKTNKFIMLKDNGGDPLRLNKCNNKGCGVFFSFDREDGLREISKEEAERGIKDQHVDMQLKGKNKYKDNHGHCFYIAFKEEPPTISEDSYFKKIEAMDYDTAQNFKKSWLYVNDIFTNKELLYLVDFDIYKGEDI
jgi:hypothetical protein